jgi:type I restriction enzyme R subunit
MTGSADDGPTGSRISATRTSGRKLANRFKDSPDPFRIVIVRDMWLTGFDAPCLHTMYADKPMQGHGLMQAIARVNRVFRDKPGGLVVDYLGLADSTETCPVRSTRKVGGSGNRPTTRARRLSVMLEKHEHRLRSCLHGLKWKAMDNGKPAL